MSPAFVAPCISLSPQKRCRVSTASVRPCITRGHVRMCHHEPRAPKGSSGASTIASTAAAFSAAVAASSSAAATTVADVLSGPLFEPLNDASSDAVRTLVWADFRVAVALFVIAPLALFFWSIFSTSAETDAVKRVLIGYWEASSLLMLTVFLYIADVPAAAFTGLFVQCVIPVTLLWWTDLLQEIKTDESALAKAFRLWRRPAVVAAAIGVLVQLPFQGCNFVSNPLENPMCAAWLEPPHRFHEILIPFVSVDLLQTLAKVGCSIYFGYLTYLVFYVLPRCGRSGRKNRGAFSSVSALKYLGLIDKNSPGN